MKALTMRELAIHGLQIALIAIGFGAVAHVIFLVFARAKPASDSPKSTSFWGVFIQRTKGHVMTQLVLFALMILVFIALGMLNKPMPLSR